MSLRAARWAISRRPTSISGTCILHILAPSCCYNGRRDAVRCGMPRILRDNLYTMPEYTVKMQHSPIHLNQSYANTLASKNIYVRANGVLHQLYLFIENSSQTEWHLVEQHISFTKTENVYLFFFAMDHDTTALMTRWYTLWPNDVLMGTTNETWDGGHDLRSPGGALGLNAAKQSQILSKDHKEDQEQFA